MYPPTEVGGIIAPSDSPIRLKIFQKGRTTTAIPRSTTTHSAGPIPPSIQHASHPSNGAAPAACPGEPCPHFYSQAKAPCTTVVVRGAGSYWGSVLNRGLGQGATVQAGSATRSAIPAIRMSATSGRENSRGGYSPRRSISRTRVPDRATCCSGPCGQVLAEAMPSQARQ